MLCINISSGHMFKNSVDLDKMITHAAMGFKIKIVVLSIYSPLAKHDLVKHQLHCHVHMPLV